MIFKLGRKKENLKAIPHVFLTFLTNKVKPKMKLSSTIKDKDSIQQNLLTTCHILGTLLTIVVETIIVAIYMHLLQYRHCAK